MALFLLGPGAFAAELHVPSQHTTIQSAVDAAADGDHVVVGPGTWRDPIDLRGKKITLRSSDGAAATILDGSAHDTSIIVAIRRESAATVVQGFTFRGGTGYKPFACGNPFPKGGAIFVLRGALTVSDCVFEDNGATDVVSGEELIDSGGAIFACESGLTVTNTRFERNGASNGGAIDVIAVGRQAVVVEGSTFRNNRGGFAGALGLTMWVASTARVQDNVFENNRAAFGGAVVTILRNETYATVRSNTIRDNRSNGSGGGLYATMAESAAFILTDVEFVRNVGSHGGGLLITASEESTATVANCSFSGGDASFGGGAHFSTSDAASIDVSGCDFSGNDAGMGGGVFAMARDVSHVRIHQARVLDNVAHFKPDVGIYWDLTCFKDGREPEGNGLYFGGGVDLRVTNGGTIVLANSLIAGNDGMRGGGVHASTCSGGAIDLVNDTIVDNGGTGAHIRYGLSTRPDATDLGTIRLVNSIVRSNTADEILIDRLDPRAAPAVAYNNVEGGYAGAGNVDLPPSFVDAAARDYRLAQGSACIDSGDNTALADPIDRTDLAKQPRRVDDPSTGDRGIGPAPVVDLGAYEYQPLRSRRRAVGR